MKMKESHTQGKYLNRYNFTFILIRSRISKAFKDGDHCHIELKNRGEKQTEEAKEWYAKAFGPK
jgi:hypothetical protein